MVDVVDQIGNFAVFCGDFELHSSALSRWSTELKERSLESTLLHGNGGAELVLEEILDESSGVLLSIDGEVHNRNSTSRGGLKSWSLEILRVQVLWLVNWSNLLVTVWQLHFLLWAWSRSTSGVMMTLVETIFMNLVDLHHGISLSIRLIALGLVIGLSNFSVWTSLIGDNWSGILDGGSNERLILKFVINIFEEFLILVRRFSLVDFTSDLAGSVLSIFLLTQGLNGSVLVIDINILGLNSPLSLGEANITPLVGGSGKDLVFLLSSLEQGSIVRDSMNLVESK